MTRCSCEQLVRTIRYNFYHICGRSQDLTLHDYQATNIRERVKGRVESQQNGYSRAWPGEAAPWPLAPSVLQALHDDEEARHLPTPPVRPLPSPRQGGLWTQVRLGNVCCCDPGEVPGDGEQEDRDDRGDLAAEPQPGLAGRDESMSAWDRNR